jgi:hypothetical protein
MSDTSKAEGTKTIGIEMRGDSKVHSNAGSNSTLFSGDSEVKIC